VAFAVVSGYEPSLTLFAQTLLFTDGHNLLLVLGESLFRRINADVEILRTPEIALCQLKSWAVMILLSVTQARSGQFLDDDLPHG